MRTRVIAAVVAVMIAMGGDAVQPLSRMTTPAKIGAAAAEAADTGVRIGTVTAYSSGSITVAISGSSTLVNAAYLSSYFPTVGDTVAVLKNGASWLVLGGFGQTQTRLIPVTNVVVTQEGTASTTFTDLATVGPTVTATVGSSGTAIVTLTADVLPGLNDGAWMGVQISSGGSVYQTPVGDRSLYLIASTIGGGSTQIEAQMSRSILFSGLTPGVNVFQAKYRTGLGTSALWADREMIVTPY